MPTEKYTDFIVSEPVLRQSKLYNDNYSEKNYVSITCPHCDKTFAEMLMSHAPRMKSTKCKAHLEVCTAFRGEVNPAPKRKKREKTPEDESLESLVTIYKIVYLPDNRAVYTGRTKNIEQRMQQHASRSSGCRLIRNAIRRHGISKFAIHPIVRCMPADADANESYYIMSNGTMHPDGYNLRHGSMAGMDRNDKETSLVATGIVNFEGVADKLRAQSEAALDVADMCDDLEDCSSTEDVCRDLLREVHPDRAGERSYSASEVSAMLNTVRDSVRGVY